jgi:NAD(P)H-hydrate repair Nnr-like enzyme with NAD(P)H-hydrate epimerase domain
MREIDRIAIEDTGPNLFQMMENAGRNLALHALDVLGTDWRDRHTLVLAGAGGNGGGGICAARSRRQRDTGPRRSARWGKRPGISTSRIHRHIGPRNRSERLE